MTDNTTGCGPKVSRMLWEHDIKWVRFPPSRPFRGSSVEERETLNLDVGGPNPPLGAKVR